AVEYFVSYYDYYQPEAYIASTDTYIEKETQINDEIDRLRHAATAAVLSRRDVIIVASVSCIYGLGSPQYYWGQTILLKLGQNVNRDELLRNLVGLQYIRSEVLERGRFRAIGENIEIMLPSREIVIRIEIEEGVIKRFTEYDCTTRDIISKPAELRIFPARHYVVPEPMIGGIFEAIHRELEEREQFFLKHGKPLEAERIRMRVSQDLEMIKEVGYCTGIENYSRYFTGRKPGDPPFTLIDYFPQDYLLVIDESHVTAPQLNGMYQGDFSRKQALIEYGFRLPSAFDNRPLKFAELEKRLNQVIFVSATPGAYELKKSREQVVQQIIRPTGLLDPELNVRPSSGQVRDILGEIQKVIGRKNRVLITTLTKKMAEDLSEFLKENQIKAEYLHSDVDTLDRIRILENLRRGKFDVLVGVNLLREGLDLPEVELVAIFDADKEGFLRSETSLIQTIGRAARNLFGRVILYADNTTGSMKRAIEETNRRRDLQAAYNKEHHITPKTIKKKIASIVDHEISPEPPKDLLEFQSIDEISAYVKIKNKEMKEAAKSLEFEKAALIRDEVISLTKLIKGLQR
ncbi:MAG: excinuclease ABC subunit UvrB, partial [Parcubacteria group bacterium]|nr:excinuclease ABC subunit UvrB [Parcubacteria group bacterium]